MSPEDKRTLNRIINEEAGDDPLFIANDAAIELIVPSIMLCDCTGCRFLRELVYFRDSAGIVTH